jgi:hypothetical protein
MNSFVRSYIYVISGLFSALIGWNLGQIFITDLGWMNKLPELILFPCVATSLAVGMVLTEILISSPTRIKLSLRSAKLPVLLAIGFGLVSGLVAGGISQALFFPAFKIPAYVVRIVGWLVIGIFIGIAEGFTWRWRSIEAGNASKYQARLWASIWGGTAASLAAAILFELLRKALGSLLPGLQSLEDPIGFALLGTLLGFVFSKTSSPSYLVALRAGAGFEYTEIVRDSFSASRGSNDDDDDEDDRTHFPIIDKNITQLSFVSDSEAERIEEGLSIQLPGTGSIHIGSVPGKSNIYIPGLPKHIADLKISQRETILEPNGRNYSGIEVNGRRLDSKKPISLKHNTILTFYTEDNDSQKEFYRFVYYNRFLDPQA